MLLNDDLCEVVARNSSLFGHVKLLRCVFRQPSPADTLADLLKRQFKTRRNASILSVRRKALKECRHHNSIKQLQKRYLPNIGELDTNEVVLI